MKFRSVTGLTLLAYTLSSPPFAAGIAQLALAPFVDSTPSPDPAHASGSDAVQTMTDTERAFSALSVEKGMKEAFLTYLADSAVIFRPAPTDGRSSWQARNSPPGTLIWEPCFAEVSRSGDLGVSTGPWEYRPPGETDPAKITYGHFITIWRRQADGSWRVALDIGGTHAAPRTGGVGSGDMKRGPDHSGSKAGSASGAGDLAQLDRMLGEASRPGLARALQQTAAGDVRFNHAGREPALGLAAARAATDSLGGGWSFATRGSGAAGSNDLAYTYGVAARFAEGSAGGTDSSSYLNVWRRDDHNRWKLSLAVLNRLQ